MVTGHRTPRSPADLIAAARQCVRLLQHAAEQFDQGGPYRDDHSRPMAVQLRTLMHNGQGGAALLRRTQHLDQLTFADTCGAVTGPDVLFSPMAMVKIDVAGGARGMTFEAPLGKAYKRLSPGLQAALFVRPQGLPFRRWWKAVVLVDGAGNQFCRRDIVLRVVNQDGGAHVDDALDTAYFELSRNKSFGFSMTWQDDATGAHTDYDPGDPTPVIVRQVTWEFLRTLQWSARDLLEA